MDQVEEIKSRLDIVDIITEYLALKPAGTGSFKACCPFHQEKTPSFYVNRPRQSWHCFGCNEGGDMISFVQRIEGMEFVEAMELLAQKSGVVLQKFEAKDQGIKKRLFDLNEYTAKLFRHILLTADEAVMAREYVAKRGIDDLTADEWRLGYAPAEMSIYTKKILDQGFTIQEIIQAGLAMPNDRGNGVYFRFKSRLTFPIWDSFGHNVGFTARILTAEKTAKYINTPETIVYKKSNVLYGLDKAKSQIKREDLAVVVEGNMDCLSSHQFGIKNVIASSGTALTTEQLTLIKRYTTNIAIAFDADNAGMNATLRGLDLARKLDFNIKIINYRESGAKDPDELVRKDPELWREAIKSAKPIMEWIYKQAFANHEANTPDGKKEVARQVLNEVSHIADPVEKDAWIVKLSEDLRVSTDALRSTLTKYSNTIKIMSESRAREQKKTPTYQPKEANNTREELEQLLLAVHMANINVIPEFKLDWSKHPHAELYNYLKQGYNLAELTNLSQETKETIDFISILADKEFGDMPSKEKERIATEISGRLLDLQKSTKKQALEEAMRAAELKGDFTKIQQLIEEFNQLN